MAQHPQERHLAAVALVERQPVEGHAVAAQPQPAGPGRSATWPGSAMSSGMPASRQRRGRRPTTSGRYNSPSSRAWKRPLATPRWTVTMPLSILPTQPSTAAARRASCRPSCRQLVSSMTPTVPRSSPGGRRRRPASRCCKQVAGVTRGPSGRWRGTPAACARRCRRPGRSARRSCGAGRRASPGSRCRSGPRSRFWGKQPRKPPEIPGEGRPQSPAISCSVSSRFASAARSHFRCGD